MRIALSVVSHSQGEQVARLLRSLESIRPDSDISVVVTLNLPETLRFDPAGFTFPVTALQNAPPAGFGANHNKAFRAGPSDYFCVCNPDIRFDSDPFPSLAEALAEPEVGLAAPAVVDSNGSIQDNIRRQITLWRLLRRSLPGARGLEYRHGEADRLRPDWVAGLFMFFSAEVFADLQGFDERFFMYCEDADICARLRRSAGEIVYLPEVHVIHDAQRASHRDLHHLYWHARSLSRLLWRPAMTKNRKAAERACQPERRGAV